MWPLFTSSTFFLFSFSVVNESFMRCQMQEEYIISFCVMPLFSLSSIARVKGGAEGALERFEELQKMNSKSVCFLLEVQYFHSLSESCRM